MREEKINCKQFSSVYCFVVKFIENICLIRRRNTQELQILIEKVCKLSFQEGAINSKLDCIFFDMH